MEILELKSIFDNGGLVSASVCRAPMGKGFILIVKSKSKKDIAMTSQRDDSPRTFKSMDAAVRNAEKIGFKKIMVDLK